MNKIEIGAVAKPQGIKGEIKLRFFADGFNSIKNIKRVEINSIEYDVEYIKDAGGHEAILKLIGVNDRNFVETLRQMEVYTDRKQLSIANNSYFIRDVIGSILYLDSGKQLGEIYDIVSGNVDYYYVKTTEGNAVFPFIKDLEAKIDMVNRTVIVNAKRFTEVVMYEN